METLVLDRKMPPDTLFSFMGVDRIMAVKQGAAALLTPMADVNEPAYDTPSIREIFNRLPIDTAGYVFNRDEANNYE